MAPNKQKKKNKDLTLIAKNIMHKRITRINNPYKGFALNFIAEQKHNFVICNFIHQNNTHQQHVS